MARAVAKAAGAEGRGGGGGGGGGRRCKWWPGRRWWGWSGWWGAVIVIPRAWPAEDTVQGGGGVGRTVRVLGAAVPAAPTTTTSKVADHRVAAAEVPAAVPTGRGEAAERSPGGSRRHVARQQQPRLSSPRRGCCAPRRRPPRRLPWRDNRLHLCRRGLASPHAARDGHELRSWRRRWWRRGWRCGWAWRLFDAAAAAGACHHRLRVVGTDSVEVAGTGRTSCSCAAVRWPWTLRPTASGGRPWPTSTPWAEQRTSASLRGR